ASGCGRRTRRCGGGSGCWRRTMPEPRPKDYWGGERIPVDKRVAPIGGKPPESPQDAQNGRQDASAPAARSSTPPGPGKRGTPHVGCKLGGTWRETGGRPRLACSGGPRGRVFWVINRETGKWERGG